MNKILTLIAIIAIFTGVIKAQENREFMKEGAFNKYELRKNAHQVDVRQQLQNEMKKIVRKARDNNPGAFTTKSLKKTTAWNFQVEDQHSFYARNFRITDSDADGYFYSVQATCRAVSEYCYVFVEDDEWNSGNVDQSSVNFISNAFSNSTPADNNKGIYDIDTEVFGFPFDVDNDPRIIILILDIQDNYGIDGNTSFTGGYNHVYNSFTVAQGAEFSNEMEMFYQDSNPADALSNDGLMEIGGTLAHEFQHMIEDGNHYMVNQLDQVTFFDEGCSETASVLCGYPGRSSSYYNSETNMNLSIWRDGSDVLGDYERAFRFTLYLYEQFGADYLSKFIGAENAQGNPLVGYDALDNALLNLAVPTTRRRGDILWDWHLASAVEDKSVNDKWGFDESVITRITGEELSDPNVSESGVALQPGGALFLTFIDGENITANFTFASQAAPGFVKAYAVKGVGASAVVEEFDLNQDVNFPDFGTAYETLTLIISSNAKSSAFECDYTISGQGLTEPLELFYDENTPLGTFNSIVGDQTAVAFSGVANTKLRTVKVALRNDGDITARVYNYTGTTTNPLGSPLCNGFTVTGTTTPDSPYPDPWTNWVEVDMSDLGISTENDFIISFTYTGDNKVMVTSRDGQTFSNSISYDSAEDSWKWYVNNDEDITYLYMIRAIIEPTNTTEIEEDETIPLQYNLSQNYPNPFNPTTNISYTISEGGNVTLRIYDVLGKLVNTLVNSEVNSGTHQVTWDGKDVNGVSVASGMYFYTIKANNFIQTRKMVLIK